MTRILPPLGHEAIRVEWVTSPMYIARPIPYRRGHGRTPERRRRGASGTERSVPADSRPTRPGNRPTEWCSASPVTSPISSASTHCGYVVAFVVLALDRRRRHRDLPRVVAHTVRARPHRHGLGALRRRRHRSDRRADHDRRRQPRVLRRTRRRGGAPDRTHARALAATQRRDTTTTCGAATPRAASPSASPAASPESGPSRSWHRLSTSTIASPLATCRPPSLSPGSTGIADRPVPPDHAGSPRCSVARHSGSP